MMNAYRYEKLMEDDNLCLTIEEIRQGWHFCPSFDYLLIHPSSEEFKVCECDKTKLKTYRN